jgi:hypothetical protein
MIATHRAILSTGAAKWDSDDPLGDQIRDFEEKLGIRKDANIYALEQMKLWHKLIGKEWDDTPVTEGIVVTRNGEVTKTQNVALAELNVEYTSMNDLNKKLAQGGK